MSRNRSIAKRMGGEHSRTPKAGDKNYAKVLFSPDEMASFESLMNEVDDVGVGGKFIAPRRDADTEAPPRSAWKDWCTGLNAVVLVVLVITAVVAVDFTRSYFPSAMTADGAKTRVDTTLETTPSPSPAARALASDLARAEARSGEADPARNAAVEGRRDALARVAGSNSGSVVSEKDGGDAETETKDVSVASDADDVFFTPPSPTNATARDEDDDAADEWHSTAVGFGDDDLRIDSSQRQEQISRNLTDALADGSRATQMSHPGADAARAAADAAEASAADAAEATSREARHEAAETDEERRARHAKEDEERRARHEKEDRERAEKHAMEDELRELRAAVKDRETHSTTFGPSPRDFSGVGVFVAGDPTTTTTNDPDATRVSYGGDGEKSDENAPDFTDPKSAPSEREPDPTLPEPLDDQIGLFTDRPADDDAEPLPETPTSMFGSPGTNANTSVPYDPDENPGFADPEDPEVPEDVLEPEAEAAEAPAATPPRRAGAKKKAATRREKAKAASKTDGAGDAWAKNTSQTSPGFEENEFGTFADAPTEAPDAPKNEPLFFAPEDPGDADAPGGASPPLPDAPGLPEEEDARFLSDALPRTGDGARTERLSDPPEDYDHASLRVGANATRASGTVADVGGGRLAPPSAANGTAPREYALDARAMTVKGLVQEPTDISDEAKRPPGTAARRSGATRDAEERAYRSH